MEYNGITEEELKQLSTIDGFDKWQKIERYFPETRYVPDSSKLKTGVISIPPRTEKAASATLRLYTVTANGNRLLMRTDTIGRFEKECDLAAFSDRIFNEGGVYVSSPVEVGAFDGDRKVYSLYNFFCGDNLARRLPEFSTSHQHAFGVEAGKQLAKLQSVLPTPDDMPAEKTDIFLMLTRMEEKGIKYESFAEASAFLKKHHSIPENRPVTAMHGSFSANTLFLDKDLNVGVLPLSEVCWGDPVSDLSFLSDGYSLPFIKGVFKGMYNGLLPNDFFELLAYYTTVEAISDVENAADEAQMETAVLRARKIASDLDNYQSVIPSWY